jgi:hypothetical protein
MENRMVGRSNDIREGVSRTFPRGEIPEGKGTVPTDDPENLLKVLRVRITELEGEDRRRAEELIAALEQLVASRANTAKKSPIPEEQVRKFVGEVLR